MTKLPGPARLEAFTDGVLAIVITLMVLELKLPKLEAGSYWQAVGATKPKLLAYAVSFVMIGIYWVNHHQLMHGLEQVSHRILWANLNLLFWLCLLPLPTGLLGDDLLRPEALQLFAGLMLLASLSFTLLRVTVHQRRGSGLSNMHWFRTSVGPVAYALAILIAELSPLLSLALVLLVPCYYLIPFFHQPSKVE